MIITINSYSITPSVSLPKMYYKNGGADEWDSLSNWYTDAAGTIGAATLPWSTVGTSEYDLLYATGSSAPVNFTSTGFVGEYVAGSCSLNINITPGATLTNGTFTKNIVNDGTIDGITYIPNGGDFTNYGTILSGTYNDANVGTYINLYSVGTHDLTWPAKGGWVSNTGSGELDTIGSPFNSLASLLAEALFVYGAEPVGGIRVIFTGSSTAIQEFDDPDFPLVLVKSERETPYTQILTNVDGLDIRILGNCTIAKFGELANVSNVTRTYTVRSALNSAVTFTEIDVSGTIIVPASPVNGNNGGLYSGNPGADGADAEFSAPGNGDGGETANCNGTDGVPGDPGGLGANLNLYAVDAGALLTSMTVVYLFGDGGDGGNGGNGGNGGTATGGDGGDGGDYTGNDGITLGGNGGNGGYAYATAGDGGDAGNGGDGAIINCYGDVTITSSSLDAGGAGLAGAAGTPGSATGGNAGAAGTGAGGGGSGSPGVAGTGYALTGGGGSPGGMGAAGSLTYH
jgi:hypothetical protein